ncbi:MAG: hypothetical protein HYV90_05545 [Candidatus Woesebacteria bacterium]|nr:MAG: hypothetical protein HYV90_05545 [Candidatus Woesebacteria bacterium]
MNFISTLNSIQIFFLVTGIASALFVAYEAVLAIKRRGGDMGLALVAGLLALVSLYMALFVKP